MPSENSILDSFSIDEQQIGSFILKNTTFLMIAAACSKISDLYHYYIPNSEKEFNEENDAKVKFEELKDEFIKIYGEESLAGSLFDYKKEEHSTKRYILKNQLKKYDELKAEYDKLTTSNLDAYPVFEKLLTLEEIKSSDCSVYKVLFGHIFVSFLKIESSNEKDYYKYIKLRLLNKFINALLFKNFSIEGEHRNVLKFVGEKLLNFEKNCFQRSLFSSLPDIISEHTRMCKNMIIEHMNLIHLMQEGKKIDSTYRGLDSFINYSCGRKEGKPVAIDNLNPFKETFKNLALILRGGSKVNLEVASSLRFPSLYNIRDFIKRNFSNDFYKMFNYKSINENYSESDRNKEIETIANIIHAINNRLHHLTLCFIVLNDLQIFSEVATWAILESNYVWTGLQKFLEYFSQLSAEIKNNVKEGELVLIINDRNSCSDLLLRSYIASVFDYIDCNVTSGKTTGKRKHEKQRNAFEEVFKRINNQTDSVSEHQKNFTLIEKNRQNIIESCRATANRLSNNYNVIMKHIDKGYIENKNNNITQSIMEILKTRESSSALIVRQESYSKDLDALYHKAVTYCDALEYNFKPINGGNEIKISVPLFGNHEIIAKFLWDIRCIYEKNELTINKIKEIFKIYNQKKDELKKLKINSLNLLLQSFDIILSNININEFDHSSNTNNTNNSAKNLPESKPSAEPFNGDNEGYDYQYDSSRVEEVNHDNFNLPTQISSNIMPSLEVKIENKTKNKNLLSVDPNLAFSWIANFLKEAIFYSDLDFLERITFIVVDSTQKVKDSDYINAHKSFLEYESIEYRHRMIGLIKEKRDKNKNNQNTQTKALINSNSENDKFEQLKNKMIIEVENQIQIEINSTKYQHLDWWTYIKSKFINIKDEDCLDAVIDSEYNYLENTKKLKETDKNKKIDDVSTQLKEFLKKKIELEIESINKFEDIFLDVIKIFEDYNIDLDKSKIKGNNSFINKLNSIMEEFYEEKLMYLSEEESSHIINFLNNKKIDINQNNFKTLIFKLYNITVAKDHKITILHDIYDLYLEKKITRELLNQKLGQENIIDFYFKKLSILLIPQRNNINPEFQKILDQKLHFAFDGARNVAKGCNGFFSLDGYKRLIKILLQMGASITNEINNKNIVSLLSQNNNNDSHENELKDPQIVSLTLSQFDTFIMFYKERSIFGFETMVSQNLSEGLFDVISYARNFQHELSTFLKDYQSGQKEHGSQVIRANILKNIYILLDMILNKSNINDINELIETLKKDIEDYKKIVYEDVIKSAFWYINPARIVGSDDYSIIMKFIKALDKIQNYYIGFNNSEYQRKRNDTLTELQIISYRYIVSMEDPVLAEKYLKDEIVRCHIDSFIEKVLGNFSLKNLPITFDNIKNVVNEMINVMLKKFEGNDLVMFNNYVALNCELIYKIVFNHITYKDRIDISVDRTMASDGAALRLM